MKQLVEGPAHRQRLVAHFGPKIPDFHAQRQGDVWWRSERIGDLIFSLHLDGCTPCGVTIGRTEISTDIDELQLARLSLIG